MVTLLHGQLMIIHFRKLANWYICGPVNKCWNDLQVVLQINIEKWFVSDSIKFISCPVNKCWEMVLVVVLWINVEKWCTNGPMNKLWEMVYKWSHE